MNNTKYTIYAMHEGFPVAFETEILTEALGVAERLRNNPEYGSIAMCSENIDRVGKDGVDAVKDGKLPDGQDYVYKTGRDRGRDPR